MTELSRKERDDQRRRQEILDTALSIFASQGFHGTTMAQISQDSQYPLGTIYKYFSSKKQIYHDLVMEKAQELGQILLSLSREPGVSAADILRNSLFSTAMFYRTNNEFIRIYISERSTIDAVMVPKLNQKINRLHDRMVTLFEQVFTRGIQAGEFRPYPPEAMAVLFSDISHSASWASLFRDETDADVNQRLSMIFDMFTQGIARDPKPSPVIHPPAEAETLF
ncbi:MAG: TetR/AcrR family transcriptional regulator [Pseudomonadota bacterium]